MHPTRRAINKTLRALRTPTVASHLQFRFPKPPRVLKRSALTTASRPAPVLLQRCNPSPSHRRNMSGAAVISVGAHEVSVKHSETVSEQKAPPVQPKPDRFSSPLYLLMKNRSVVPGHEHTGAKELLQTLPEGAYTTMRTVKRTLVFKLSFHLQRLVDSVAFMASSAGSTAAEKLKHPTMEWLGAEVRGHINDACNAFEKSLPPSLSAGVPEYRITVLLNSSDGWATMDTYVHVGLLTNARTGASGDVGENVKVFSTVAMREHAHAKTTDWVRVATKLAETKPADVDEVVLLTPTTDESSKADSANPTADTLAIYEGLSSNAFVVTSSGVVQTADDGVLAGSVRAEVIDGCESLKIPLKRQAPLLSGWQSWRGLFITSTSRLVLPVHSFSIPADVAKRYGITPDHKNEPLVETNADSSMVTMRFSYPSNSVTVAIQEAVYQRLKAHCEPISVPVEPKTVQ